MYSCRLCRPEHTLGERAEVVSDDLLCGRYRTVSGRDAETPGKVANRKLRQHVCLHDMGIGKLVGKTRATIEYLA